MVAQSASCTAAKDGGVMRSWLAGIALFGRFVAHERKVSPDGLWRPLVVFSRSIVGIDSTQRASKGAIAREGARLSDGRFEAVRAELSLGQLGDIVMPPRFANQTLGVPGPGNATLEADLRHL